MPWTAAALPDEGLEFAVGRENTGIRQAFEDAQLGAAIVESSVEAIISGGATIGISAIVRDLTEQKRRPRTPQGLTKAEDLVRLVMASASIGIALAGVVEQVGEGIRGFAGGDEVFGGQLAGGFAEYAVLPAEVVAHKPARASFTQAAIRS